MLRLQDTYQLSANTISNGDLPGEHVYVFMHSRPLANLYQAHCVTTDTASVISCYYISLEILSNVPMGLSDGICAIVKKWKHGFIPGFDVGLCFKYLLRLLDHRWVFRKLTLVVQRLSFGAATKCISLKTTSVS